MASEMLRRSATAADGDLRDDYLKLASEWAALARGAEPKWPTRTRYEIRLLGEDGALLRAEALQARDDDAAIDQAGGLLHPLGMEVWCGDRLVAAFPSPSPAVAAVWPKSASSRR